MASMEYNKDKGAYTLKSGRVIYAKGGILGLCPSEEEHTEVLFGGWDSMTETSYDGKLRDDQGRLYKLTQEERYEIAAEMIHRWLRWAEG